MLLPYALSVISVAAFFSVTISVSEAQSTSFSAAMNDSSAARFWRTANNNDPAQGHPQYTFGSHDNTPTSPSAAQGTYTFFKPSQWTSGFFSQGMWLLYDRMKSICPSSEQGEGQVDQQSWLLKTKAWTEALSSNINVTDTHDIGFLAEPFESALNLFNDTSWLATLSQMSTNLANRFVAKPAVLRCWDGGSQPDSVLVIIDSAMNLPFLVRGGNKYNHNSTMIDMVNAHASRLIDNNIRPDGSTFHVCDYSGTTGDLYSCHTAQGLADNSTWSRGQAWALNGFTQLYGLLKNQTYLTTARKTADYFIDNLPLDGVPYWDFNAPPDPQKTPRDVSAAMIATSGLLSLSQYTMESEGNRGPNKYSTAAVSLLNATMNLALATPIDWQQASSNARGASTTIQTTSSGTDTSNFESILMHSTVNGNKGTNDGDGSNQQSNFDTGLIYADRYFIEAASISVQMKLFDCQGNANSSAAAASNGGKGASSNGAMQTLRSRFHPAGSVLPFSLSSSLMLSIIF